MLSAGVEASGKVGLLVGGGLKYLESVHPHCFHEENKKKI